MEFPEQGEQSKKGVSKRQSEASMTSATFRVESSHPIAARLLPVQGLRQYLFSDRALAVALAAKSVTTPQGQEIRVVHVPTGEVVFRKAASLKTEALDES
jgi:hypothetical protein